ncbi:hypothetical protein ADICYQ_3048 [Cyclobacterium qasimii M12-11B]|uniref:Uncharacterized protein n=1 Tax=Cyclobacterium qasimii M12-11B TaxID=641524 RepID=S7VDA2_9BACT|nr:hypothetical protein ADICYQ_3048 [Cyclobacterium qasimii M12-11B]
MNTACYKTGAILVCFTDTVVLASITNMEIHPHKSPQLVFQMLFLRTVLQTAILPMHGC